MSIYRDKRRVPRRFFWILLLVLAIIAFFGLRRGPAPTLTLDPSLAAVGPSTEITVRVEEPRRGISSFRVLAVQGEDIELAAEEHSPRPAWAFWLPATGERQVTVLVGTEHQEGLAEGPLTVRVESFAAGTWLLPPRPVTQELELSVRLTPPTLNLVSRRPVVRQGGSGAVTYRVGSTAVRHGVRVGELDIEGYTLPHVDDGSGATPADESAAGETTSFVLYGVPHDLELTSEIQLFAVDELGNRAERSFLSRFDRREFTSDDIQLSEGFLNKVVPEILEATPGFSSTGDLLQDYLKVNRELRSLNGEQLLDLSRASVPERLWRGAFTQLPSSRVMAVFGDHRTYFYEGQAVDQQTHLGHDLASVRRAPVPAANHGLVVLAGYLGIYGKTVVIDHGFGLLSLYSHLSEVSVQEGDRVEKGQTLGRTGVTGMAGGDHLHFTVMAGGVMVEPLEWWDKRWLETRIQAMLGSSFAIDD